MARTTVLFTLALLAFLSIVFATPAELSESELSKEIPELEELSEIEHQTEPFEIDHKSKLSDSDHQILPLHVSRGCQTRSGSHIVASCHDGELCRYTCRCRALRKDRFSIICGVRPPLYLGILHRTRAVIRMRGGAVYSDTGKRCGC